MKILMCHNYYQQPGGEDTSFAQETELLRAHGHEVVTFTQHNSAIEQMGRVEVALRTIWNRQSYRQLRRLIVAEQPDVMHCTNTFPLISPAAYYAAQAEGVAVVQSLRNYRLLCPGAFLLRNGSVCEKCIGAAFPWPAIRHRCYRDSRSASAAVALQLALHWAMGTWTGAVDMYFALTQFARRKFIEGGLPEQKVAVKPNFLSPDPGPGNAMGEYALFVGRLSPEKGVATLLDAWSRAENRLPLRIVGDGPLNKEVAQAARENPNITWLGRRNSQEVLALLGDAVCLVVPSLWYEGFPRTILEALARGTPVIASRLGSMAEIVEHGRTGLHFQPGSADELAQAVTSLAAADPAELAAMRRFAREDYLQKYTADKNYDMLMSIYECAISNRDMAQPERREAVSPVP